MIKTNYATFDSETWGGAANPKGAYHMGVIIHDREGNIICCANYLIAEYYDKINKDKYGKKNFEKYEEMKKTGIVTMVDTEEHAIEMIEQLLNFYNVKYIMAYNSAFDFCKTACAKLIENRQFIDLWLMALETIIQYKSYSIFCHENNLRSTKGKSCSTSAETVYAFLTKNPNYIEEHTALEDCKIEVAIFTACNRAHKKYTRNTHYKDKKFSWALCPQW